MKEPLNAGPGQKQLSAKQLSSTDHTAGYSGPVKPGPHTAASERYAFCSSVSLGRNIMSFALHPSTLPIFNSNDSSTMSLRFIDMQGCRGSHYYTELIGPPFFCFLSNPSPSPPCFVSSLPYIVFGLWFISKPDYWAEDQSSKYVSKADMSIVVYFVPKCPSL